MNNSNNPDNIKTQNWVRIKVPPELLKELSRREDIRPMRDMLIWLGLILFFCLSYDFFVGRLVGNYTTLYLLGVI